MVNLSREQLEAQLQKANTQIITLKKELKELNEIQKAYDDGFKLGTQLAAMKRGLVEAGLSDLEAMDVILTAMKAGAR